jgi:hypothetical protein
LLTAAPPRCMRHGTRVAHRVNKAGERRRRRRSRLCGGLVAAVLVMDPVQGRLFCSLLVGLRGRKNREREEPGRPATERQIQGWNGTDELAFGSALLLLCPKQIL